MWSARCRGPSGMAIPDHARAHRDVSDGRRFTGGRAGPSLGAEAGEGSALRGPYLAGNRPPCSPARRISGACRRWGRRTPTMSRPWCTRCSAWTRRCGAPSPSSAAWPSTSGWHPGTAEAGTVNWLRSEHVFYSTYGSAAAELVVLPEEVRERARVGAGPDHCQLDAVRVRPGSRGPRERPGPRGRVLRGGEGLPVGLVPAAARTGRSAPRRRRASKAGPRCTERYPNIWMLTRTCQF
jgi:hypothetical protein